VAALFGFIGSIREKELVAFALMIALAVIMRAELPANTPLRIEYGARDCCDFGTTKTREPSGSCVAPNC